MTSSFKLIAAIALALAWPVMAEGITPGHEPAAVPAVPTPAAPPSVRVTPVATPPSAPDSPVATSPFPAAEATSAFSTQADDVSFYNDEAGLQRQLRLLTLKAQIQELKKKLSDGPGSISAGASPVAVLPPPLTSQSSTDAHDAGTTSQIATFRVPTNVPPRASTSGAQLISVIGAAGQFQANISIGGSVLTVRPGSVLSDGWVVDSIGPASVILAKGRKHKTLTVGD